MGQVIMETGSRQSARNALLESAERLERRAKGLRALAEIAGVDDLPLEAEALLWELSSRSNQYG